MQSQRVSVETCRSISSWRPVTYTAIIGAQVSIHTNKERETRIVINLSTNQEVLSALNLLITGRRKSGPQMACTFFTNAIANSTCTVCRVKVCFSSDLLRGKMRYGNRLLGYNKLRALQDNNETARQQYHGNTQET